MDEAAYKGAHEMYGTIVSLILMLYILLTLLSLLSLNARRLHDIGRNGWWFLMFFVPLIGTLTWLFWMITPSDDGDNAYSPPG